MENNQQSCCCQSQKLKNQLPYIPYDNPYILESGTDLRYIQELLGHNCSKTNGFSPVSDKSIRKIISPLDML